MTKSETWVGQMNGYPKVSVITPALNSAATITECIQSVASQDYGNIEHIVVDGESTDGTLELAAVLEAECGPHQFDCGRKSQ